MFLFPAGNVLISPSPAPSRRGPRPISEKRSFVPLCTDPRKSDRICEREGARRTIYVHKCKPVQILPGAVTPIHSDSGSQWQKRSRYAHSNAPPEPPVGEKRIILFRTFMMLMLSSPPPVHLFPTSPAQVMCEPFFLHRFAYRGFQMRRSICANVVQRLRRRRRHFTFPQYYLDHFGTLPF